LLKTRPRNTRRRRRDGEKTEGARNDSGSADCYKNETPGMQTSVKGTCEVQIAATRKCPWEIVIFEGETLEVQIAEMISVTVCS